MKTPKMKARKIWRMIDSDGEAAEQLARGLGASLFIGQVLVNRGLRDRDSVEAFLRPQLSQLEEPGRLPGIERAAKRIAEATTGGEVIKIYGDYDVDGTTSVALLYRLLRSAGAKVGYYVPNRLEEGYGLNMEAMEQIAGEGTQLVVTVDCGITAVEEAAYLAERGIDLVITDHHEGGDARPTAAAIVDPKVEGGGEGTRWLAGVGVAFKLAWATAQEISGGRKVREDFRTFLVDALGLVALGTIADVVPLVGENRALVSYGLGVLSRSETAGVRALVDACGLRGKEVTSQKVAFMLAPRLNAAGRMGQAEESVRLFVTDDAEEAKEIALSLERQNSARQSKQKEIVKQALDLVREQVDLERDRGIVLWEESWHSGVIGIVASRLVEEFHRPTVVITLEGEEGQGSGRSIPAVNLFEALHAVQETLVSFGGHAQAAGLRVRREKVKAFRDAFCEEVGRRVTAEELRPVLDIDALVTLRDVDANAVGTLERLEPYGQGNARPVLSAREVRVVGEPKRIGTAGAHLSMMVRQGNRAVRAIAFGRGTLLDAVAESRLVDIAFAPFFNTFGGKRSVELKIEDMAVY